MQDQSQPTTIVEGCAIPVGQASCLSFDRIFHVPVAGVDLTLRDLTVRHGTTLVGAPPAMAHAFELGEHELVVDVELASITVPIANAAQALTRALRALDAEGVVVVDVRWRRPSLDDVFLNLTGHLADDEFREEQPEPRPLNRRRRDT